MRFAIAATDTYLGVFEAFVDAGWKPLKLFTVPVQNLFDSHDGVIALAGQHQAKVQLSRMTLEDLQELHDQKCEALIVASYNWKIRDWRPYLKYAVNFHPSPLPEGRGPYPLVRAIIERRQTWGITCHRLTRDVDAGEILAADHFPMQNDESHESLKLKLQIAAKRLAQQVAGQFPNLWGRATPQTGGSYWPKWNNFDRLIDFSMPVQNVLCHVRAFGALESLIQLNNNVILSFQHAVGWLETHNYLPGHIIRADDRTILFAAKDGYIGVFDWKFATPDITNDIAAKMISQNSVNHDFGTILA